MHKFIPGGNLSKYDSSTLFCEIDKDRMRRQKLAEIKLLRAKKGKIIEEKYEDYLIKLNSDMPLDFIRPL